MKTIVIELKNEEYKTLNRIKLAHNLTWKKMLVDGCNSSKGEFQ
jgi:hypothetical protein